MPDVARLRALLADLQRRAQPPEPSGLVPFLISGTDVGRTQGAIATFLARVVPGFAMRDGKLLIYDTGCDFAARSALLGRATNALRDAGLLPGWRNELLAVAAPASRPLAAIERAACRPFGITTTAVHLNAYADDATLIVARRSAHKQIDPGCWDNLVGGMVPADESLEQALTREAWEEAGLKLDWQRVTRGRCFQLRRPVPEGFQSELVHVYDTILGPEVMLENQDGEVGAIERRALDAVIEAIERGEFTLESALVTLESLTRRAGTGSPPGLYD
jgi:8-oxo-dGTP pyrophosphatase MutT (NUDIX family)